MFGKKSLAYPQLAGVPDEAQGLPLGPFASRYAQVAGAGVLFLGACATLIAVAGDPRAGAPRVRVPLTSASAASLAAIPVTGVSSTAASLAGADPAAADAPVGALPQAPLAGLFQPGPSGPLPVIAPDGRTSAQAYARPFHDTGKPKVALVIGGLGLNATATRQAIEELPPEVTLSFVPYSEGLQGWIDMARAAGHEVLLETPMEPADYPQNDPGPYTLLASDPAPATTKRLEWLLGRASGYFGLTNYLGGRFLASDSAMSTFLGAVRQRGLAFVDDGSARNRSGAGAPRASAERIIDEDLDGEAITGQLSALEASAQSHGKALGSGFAYPVTLQQVKAWAVGLSAKGVQLAPASAVMNRG
jgi:polysaccharide deacetylase 2 family uncharacterized protein YibQ